MVVLNQQGVPKDPKQIGQVRTLFVDLSHSHVRPPSFSFSSFSAPKAWGRSQAPGSRVLEADGNVRAGRVVVFQLGERVFLVCRIVRVGKMNPTDKEKAPVTFRRPFGAAVYEVTDWVDGGSDAVSLLTRLVAVSIRGWRVAPTSSTPSFKGASPSRTSTACRSLEPPAKKTRRACPSSSSPTTAYARLSRVAG